MKKKLFTFKSIGKSTLYVLIGIAFGSIPFIVDYINGGRTPLTSKWDLSVGDEIKYTCITYNELEKKIRELENQYPKPSYEEYALSGIGSWLCEQGWRN